MNKQIEVKSSQSCSADGRAALQPDNSSCGLTGRAFDSLTDRCRSDPDRTRLTFLSDDGGVASASGSDLILRAEQLGRQLYEASSRGDRVLLAFPAGIDFVVGFLASVRAGLIPVPVPYPKPRRPLSRYQSIAVDSGATLGLTDLETLRRHGGAGDCPVTWISNQSESRSELPAQPFSFDRPDPEMLFLQYTSGSTGTPKGVCVTHSNLMANLRVISQGFGLNQLDPDRRVVCSWLPAYHDMGLVGVLLSTLIYDGHAVLLSPTSFMQQPSRWLAAIGHYHAAITVAPSFGYRYSASRVSDDELSQLDLSSLKVAACGAEPIEPTVLDNFARKFSRAGFDPRAFYPCYGLAESTLMVTGVDRGRIAQESDGFWAYDRRRISRSGLRNAIAKTPENEADAVELVCCGVTDESVVLRIVDPESGMQRLENQIGEIWVSSSSVAAGYWSRPDESQRVFLSQLAGDQRRYLRTGDLGFLDQGQLYVTGRLKDLMIIRGQNHYPEDLERTVQSTSDQLVDCLGAAFSVSDAIGESLVICQEVPRGFSQTQATELLRALRLAVASEHDLVAKSIALLRFASMPRTSSGKVQRGRCRDLFLSDQLKVVAQWDQSTRLDPNLFPDLKMILRRSGGKQELQQRIERVLVRWLVVEAGAEKELIDAEVPFAQCGIDSLMAVELSGQLERWLEVRLSPVIAWSHPNAKKLSQYLASQITGQPANQYDIHEAEPQQLPVGNQPTADLEKLLADVELMSDEEAIAELDKL